MTIDVTTISFVATTIDFVLAAALAIQWRMNRRYNGLGWWALGFATGCLGFGFTFLRAFPQLESIGVIGNNILFVLEQVFLYTGALRFFGQRERRAWILSFLAVFIILDVYYTVIDNNLVIRRNIFNLSCAAFLFLAARATIRYKGHNVSVTANYLAAAFGFECAVFVLSTLLNSIFPADAGPLIASLSQVNSMMGGVIGTVMEAFGIILLVNQRLIADTQNANDNLELLFNTNPDAVLLTRLSGASPAVRVNDGFIRLFGLSRAEVLNTSAFNTTIWKDPAVRQKLLSILEEKGEFENFEAVFRRQEGSEFFGLVSAKLFQMEGTPYIISVTRDITERKNAEHAIRQSEEKFSKAFQTSPYAITITRMRDSKFIEVNDAFSSITGISREEALADSALGLNMWVNPEERAQVVASLRTGSPVSGLEYLFYRKNGEIMTGLLSAQLIKLNEEDCLLSSINDITDGKRSENLIRSRMELMDYSATHPLAEVLQKALDLVGDLTDSPIGFYHFVGSDQKTIELQAWSTRTIQDFCQIRETNRHYPIEKAGLWSDCVVTRQVVIHNNFAALPNRKGMPEGHAQVARELMVPILRGERVVAILGLGNKPADYTSADAELVRYFADETWEITERKRLEEELHLQATTDELTGVFNRRYFLRVAQQELHRTARLNHATSVAIIDLDHFKQINDTYGHSVGDQALIAFSKICQKNIRDIDVFARFGGDEFVLFFVETELEQACSVVERMRQMVSSQPILLEGRLVALSMTAGVAASLAGSDSLDGLISRADQALYQAKQSGRNQIGIDQASGAAK